MRTRALCLLLCACASPPSGPRVELADGGDGTLAVAVDGRSAFAYQGAPCFAIPHVHPLIGPGGRTLLVQQTEPFPHHRSLWIADRVQLEGGRDVDYYHDWKNLRDPERPELGHASFIRHDRFADLDAGPGRAAFTVHSTWVEGTGADGAARPVLADQRWFEVRALGGGEYLIDLRWELTAAYGPVTFRSDAVHYAWPFLRMDPAYSVPQGGVLCDDRGRTGQAATHGEVARWIDFSNTVEGQPEGVAVFVFPDGEEHSWLTRDYGTFGPRRPAATSGTGFVLAEGRALGGRVGILVHRGDAVGGRVEERYLEYVGGEGPWR
jgi:hypothetical protein